MPEFENGTPTGISFGRDGRVLIPDTHYSRIIEFSPSGEILAQWGGYGTGEDEFIYPTDIAQGADGTYYISEYGVGAERVHAFDADRRFAQQWGGHGNAPGQFSRAMAIALDDRAVYVCDTANHRVQVFTREGGFVRTIGEAGTGREQLNFPHDIAVAADGTIIVCEYGNNRLSRFTLEGRGVACAGGPGRAPGRFNTPRGVAVSPNGQVFVADTDNDRVQRFSLEDLA
jgi:DNA-binding beta-propeller fold protein YncE